MRVKRYIVDNMPEALQQIRSELGNDAVILNTKEFRSGGLFGWFGKKKIEVIAAVDENDRPKPAAAAARARTAHDSLASVRENRAAKADAAQANSRPVLSREDVLRTGSSETAVAEAPFVQTAGASAACASDSGPEAPAIPRAAAGETGSAARPAFAGNPNQELLDEIRQMKDMVVRLTRQQQAEHMPRVLGELAAVLEAQDVAPAHIERWMNAVMEAAGDELPAMDERAVRELLKAEIRKVFSQEKVQGIQPDSKVVHVVGPTGVGKTTTIAKLAAEQVLKHRRKVGFITSDTYRIAAVEQLKTYATILNVPLEVVFSPHELTRAYAQLQDRDIIFMDTAGRNFRNPMYVSELNSLLTTQAKSETYLVLSLTTRYRDMKAITDNFSRFKLDKVLLTKVDETDTYGAILNLAMDYPLTFSYITNGQNVPDDISLVDAEVWIDRILEANAHE